MELIEREAAENAIAKLMPSFTTPDGSGKLDEIIFYAQQMCASAIDAILELPTIDAAPVAHGKWKFLNDYESRCTSCGKEIFIDHDDEYRYCPNCGCKMDGGEEHEAN